ncbi:MAG: alpha/beta hydrolase [Leptothrix sp. (in: b-proteobacteria)]
MTAHNDPAQAGAGGIHLAPEARGAWLDQQYNARAAIPEHAQLFARWAADSARVRAQLRCELDIAYGDGGKQTLDVFPAAEPDAPVLVFIHGGWWRSLDKSDHSFVAPAFVQGGATVVMPNYDLCPAVGIDVIVQQMTRALAWTWRHIGRYGGDRERLVVVGHSAGAHLAAMLMGCNGLQVGADLPPQLLRQGVGLSGLYDLEPVWRTPFVQGDLRLDQDLVRRLSPAGLPAPKGRFSVLVGADESTEFQRQSRLIQQAWGPRVVPVCEALPDVHHLNIVDELAEPGTRAQSLVWELLDAGG